MNKIIDYADQLPDHRRRLIETNYIALKAYLPETYHGRMILFKSRARPLFGVFDPETSWLKLATEGVEVITVPGSHEGMFKGTQAQVLAGRLKEAIEKLGRTNQRGACLEHSIITARAGLCAASLRSTPESAERSTEPRCFIHRSAGRPARCLVSYMTPRLPSLPPSIVRKL